MNSNDFMPRIVHNIKFSYFSIVRITGELILKPWLILPPIFKMSIYYQQYRESQNELYTFLDNLMEQHERDYQQKTKSTDHSSQGYLDKVYEMRDTMTYEQARESIYNFLAAGFDTSGKTISSVLLFLAMNQDVQEKVVDELRSVLIDEEGEINEESLSAMEYLDAVIKESLRLLPIAVLAGREVKKDIKLSKKSEFEIEERC